MADQPKKGAVLSHRVDLTVLAASENPAEALLEIVTSLGLALYADIAKNRRYIEDGDPYLDLMFVQPVLDRGGEL